MYIHIHNYILGGFTAITVQYVFDYQEGDVFACVAVLGWITGHTYVVYGPLCNGATTVLFEGTATYPDEGENFKHGFHSMSSFHFIIISV